MKKLLEQYGFKKVEQFQEYKKGDVTICKIENSYLVYNNFYLHKATFVKSFYNKVELENYLKSL